jgi:methylmalonyl-CoA mutase, N-terminal domain
VDPLGGSYYVEALTTAVEEAAARYLEAIGEMGGAARAIEYMQEEVHRAAYEHQLAVEAGERVVVGVNRWGSPTSARSRRRSAASSPRCARRARRVRGARPPLGPREAADGTENLMPRLIEAVKARVTLGEISDAFREAWGTYHPASGTGARPGWREAPPVDYLRRFANAFFPGAA